MSYVYIIAGLVSLLISVYFHFKLKDQASIVKAEKRLIETGAIVGGSCVRHGMVITSEGSLIPDQKPTANYYSRLRNVSAST